MAKTTTTREHKINKKHQQQQQQQQHQQQEEEQEPLRKKQKCSKALFLNEMMRVHPYIHRIYGMVWVQGFLKGCKMQPKVYPP